MRKSWPQAGCISSAPNATNPGASTTSSEAVPDARATPFEPFYLSLEDNLMRIFGDPTA